MRHRNILALGGTAALAAAAVTTALAVSQPAAKAAPQAAPAAQHVLVFQEKPVGRAVDKGPLLIQAGNGYQRKTEVSADVVDCRFGRTTASCQFALATGPGLLYGHFTEKPDNTLSGVVTGGTGSLRHARGTIAGSGTITVRYRT